MLYKAMTTSACNALSLCCVSACQATLFMNCLCEVTKKKILNVSCSWSEVNYTDAFRVHYSLEKWRQVGDSFKWKLH